MEQRKKQKLKVLPLRREAQDWHKKTVLPPFEQINKNERTLTNKTKETKLFLIRSFVHLRVLFQGKAEQQKEVPWLYFIEVTFLVFRLQKLLTLRLPFVKLSMENLLYREHAAPIVGAALRHGSTTNSHVHVMQHDDAPFACPFLHAFTRSWQPPVKLDDPDFGILAAQCLLGPQTKIKATNCAKATVFSCIGSVGLQLSALKGQCTVTSGRELASVNQGPYFQCALHIVTADKLDKASTQTAGMRPANNSKL